MIADSAALLGASPLAAISACCVEFCQSSLLKRSVLPWKRSSVGFANAPGTPKGMSDGPIARMITLLPAVPVAIIPPIMALSPLRTRSRVEMFPKVPGVMVGIGVGVDVGVGLG